MSLRKVKFTDVRPRYRNAEESSQPGYLARRLKVYARLMRMRRRHNVITLRKERAA